MPTALPDNDKELSNVPGPMGEDGDLKIHEKSIDTVAKELQTDLAKGISSAEAAARFEKYGPNELEQPHQRPPRPFQRRSDGPSRT